MTAPRYDLVVIGAGIHGAGVAQAASAAGYKVLLLEKSKPAAGTSSRSSKLIHGGLRYLETGGFSLIRESLRERKILLRVAPGLVKLVPFFIPIYSHSSRRSWKIRVGLSLYACLGRFRPETRFTVLDRKERDRIEGLRKEGLRKVFSYFDAQTDDEALTRAVLNSAVSLGAEALFPAQFMSANNEGRGYRVCYEFQGDKRECGCTVLVNAAGPWVNRVQARVSPPPPKVEVDLVQGAHILLEKKISGGLYYTEAPGDRRPVFIMPWKDYTLVGTTETLFTGDPDCVEALPEEISYLQETLHFYFPEYDGKLVGSFAGLRVLPRTKKNPFRRSRETIFVADNRRKPHFVSIYGGKLTGYRATAAKVMKLVRPVLPEKKEIARTEDLTLTP